jgi:hypothetical protein
MIASSFGVIDRIIAGVQVDFDFLIPAIQLLYTDNQKMLPEKKVDLSGYSCFFWLMAGVRGGGAGFRASIIYHTSYQ